MQEQIYGHLSAGLAAPVTWGVFPEGASAPRVTLTRVSVSQDYHLQGRGLATTRLQVDCFAETYEGVAAISRQARDLLEGYRAAPIQGVFLETERDGLEGSDTPLRRITLTFSLTHSE